MNAIEELRRHGWSIEERPAGPLRLPPAVLERHPELPAGLIGFLSVIASGVDAARTSWFLGEADFWGTSDSAFRWDEWERLSLAAAEGDDRWATEIRGFWDNHLPFLLSVEDGYGFHAVVTGGDRFGRVVAGRGPEFEDVELVAASFDEFLAVLAGEGPA